MGKVIMSGIVPPLVAPISGILASDLAVGSVVKLMENGVATEYLVVNQGKPSGSSLYDDSCDGTWLLRKDIKENRQWHSSNVNDYQNSTIHAWLNGDFYNQFGAVEQTVVKQVKIPYVNGAGPSGSVASGANGIPLKIFLLSGYEIGYTTSDLGTIPVDGAKIDYFSTGTSGASRILRFGYLNGTATDWWLRSPATDTDIYACHIESLGFCNRNQCIKSYGMRPALVLPSNALFDTKTLILKGVA